MNKKIVSVLILSILIICAGMISIAQAEEQKSTKKIITYISYAKEYNTKSDNAGSVKIVLYNKGNQTESVTCNVIYIDANGNDYITYDKSTFKIFHTKM